MSKVAKRYKKETSGLEAKELEENGVIITPDQDTDGNKAAYCWNCTIIGPERYSVNGEERACPYAGKKFSVEMRFPNRYPFKAPEVTFKPPIYHPNVMQEGKEAGSLCEDFVKGFWAPTKKAHQFLYHIRGLLSAPDLDTALAEDISAQMRKDIEAFEKAVAKKHAE